jgi:hypothetical protein
MASLHRSYARGHKLVQRKQFASRKLRQALPPKQQVSTKPVKVQSPYVEVKQPKKQNPVLKAIGKLFTRGRGR